MYASVNFKSKRALQDAVKRQEQIRVFQRNGDLHPTPQQQPDYTGLAFLEGPHYPEPHRWYATVQLVDGVIVKVS